MTELRSLFAEYMHAQGHALDAAGHAALVETAVNEGNTDAALIEVGHALKALADTMVGILTAEARKADAVAYQKLADRTE